MIGRRVLLLVLGLFAADVVAAAGNYSPTAKEIRDVDARTAAYFQAMARADFPGAYAMLSPGLQAMYPPARWRQFGAEATALRGKDYVRKQMATTWLLDPPDAQGPGLYAIIDFIGLNKDVPTQSEYLIWLRAPGKKEFRLLRQEQKALGANDVAAGKAADPAPLNEAQPETTGMGYATVSEAREALATKPGATVTDAEDGWRVVVEEASNVVWSFAPAGHPAFPSVVRRATVQRDGGVYIDMSVICEADKSACEQLVRQFQAMNMKAAEQTD
ncbi:hypothetical protein BH11PSE14_BH11PSE14_01370 [soil metagenome]